VAGKKPETPTVWGLLAQSWTMGILMFVQTIILVQYGHLFLSDTFQKGYIKSMDDSNAGGEMDRYMETTIFLQISNSSAILILSARTVGFFFTTVPAWQLLFSTALGQILINIWVFNPPGTIVKKMEGSDVVAIWIYDVLWLLFLDIVKMTAGAIWEKVKSPDIDSNPALQGEQRKKRMSNNLQGGYVVASAHLGNADSEDVKEKKKRISARLEQGR